MHVAVVRALVNSEVEQLRRGAREGADGVEPPQRFGKSWIWVISVRARSQWGCRRVGTVTVPPKRVGSVTVPPAHPNNRDWMYPINDGKEAFISVTLRKLIPPRVTL